MKDETILSTQNLRIGFFDEGREIDRSALLNCPNEFPGVAFQVEPSVHRSLRNAGMAPEQLSVQGNDFNLYRPMTGFDLLLIVFRSGNQRYLRSVNFLGKYVSTVVLDLKTPTCGDILRAQRLVVFESHPPIADVFLDERLIGEAPVWAWLRDGAYQVTCKLPGQKFTPRTVTIPKEVRSLCSRENVDSSQGEPSEDKMTGEEKAGSALLYIVGAAASLAAIVLPILLFF